MLEDKDAIRILSWIKDPEINQYFQFNSAKANLDSVLAFIKESKNQSESIHMAVVDDNDFYLGTISLKNINLESSNAEYAISMCKDAHGTGAAKYATGEILKIAFENLNLNRVYLNVLSDNIRANKFYMKNHFIFEGELKEHIQINGVLKDLKWYRLLKCEFSYDSYSAVQHISE